MSAWWDHTKDQIQPTTAKRYGVSFKSCMRFLAGKDLQKIDGRTISELIAGRKRDGASAATIRRDLTAISRVLEFAEGEGWREGNPTLSKRRTVKERREPIVLPDPADVERIITSCSPAFAALVRAAWLTGCRQNELVMATWRDVDMVGGTLEVIGKGRKRRVIALSAVARAFIAERSGKVPSRAANAPIFPAADGEAFRQAASDFTHFRREIEKKDRAAGLKFRRFRFHDLRHLFAVEYLRTGGNLYTLSKSLGHTSVKTTESVYLAFLTPEQADKAKS